ncbi:MULTISPECIES: DUF434 domain-containing protein [unclassified Aureispira]|uniref:DUF434 domain-containing protein n=1 Tax=unclassified Aureispira TaxID=2649989 RepID=UPI0006970CB0|nr:MULTISPECIES: DUF434 domain-containing protein [unclassified Aureispira]WMX17496.1 DUF434 domain-containing protein [Aureispira sp. CCB-E]
MKHRGKHSQDNTNFAPKWHPIFAAAAGDLSFLLGKQYGEKSALALVGNRYQLNKRQQRALSLITCPSDKLYTRSQKALLPQALNNQSVAIDGYNLLITIEAALSKGYILVGQDGCYRDIASVHSTYKKVNETIPALLLIDKALKELDVKHVQWYFDAPVSNSGRLKVLLYELAEKNKSNWDVDLVFNPDSTLIEKEKICITADSWILDEVGAYFDLAKYIITKEITDALVLDFFSSTTSLKPD